MKKFFYILFVLLSLPVFSFPQPVKSEYNLLKRVYGYLYAQQFELSTIKELFPQLADDVNKAEFDFNIAFGVSKTNIEKKLKDLLGKDYEAYIANIRNIDIYIDKENMTIESASSFIKEIKERANGAIESPILETLLTYQYMEKPANEFLSGFYYTFSTEEHPKSKGINLEIKIPKSWLKQEGDRDNIVQKFISNNGTGTELILIMIKDIPGTGDNILSEDEIERYFDEDEHRKFLPQGSRYISSKNIMIDRNQGVQISFEQKVTRLDMDILMQSINYITIVKNKLIYVQCLVSEDEKEGLSSHFDRFTHLFRLIANSIVIKQK